MEIKQSIRESVKVLASFQPKSIRIYFFSWRNRTYKVDSMNMFHISKDADKHFYHFAVSSCDNTYELVFDPSGLSWQLEEITNPEGG